MTNCPLGIAKKIKTLSSPKGCSNGEGMQLRARWGLRRLARDRQSKTPRYAAKGELSPNTSSAILSISKATNISHRLIMWGRFYKHSPQALVTPILQLQGSVWQRSSELARKLKTAQKVLSWCAPKIKREWKSNTSKMPRQQWASSRCYLCWQRHRKWRAGQPGAQSQRSRCRHNPHGEV